MAGLGAALLFERWNGRDETQWEFTPTDGAADTFEFHPEPIVRWDDEANPAAATPTCARRSASDLFARARTQSETLCQRSFIR